MLVKDSKKIRESHREKIIWACRKQKIRIKNARGKKKNQKKAEKVSKSLLTPTYLFMYKKKTGLCVGGGWLLRLHMLCKLNLHKLNRSSLMITLRRLK